MNTYLQQNATLDLLTTAEAADYLRMGERKLYELVSEGGIPCTKVTGKWLFPRHELNLWLASGLARPAGMPQVPAPLIAGGSHDDLFHWVLRASGSGLASLPEGSSAGVQRVLKGEVMVAAIHLHGPHEDENVHVVSTAIGLSDAVLIGFARRQQGLVLAAGNPHGVTTVGQAVRLRFVFRPEGAGASLLLESLLAAQGASVADLKAGPVCPTGNDLAHAIKSGHADAGIAHRSVAEQAGLHFLPLAWENLDLLMRQRDWFRPPMQAVSALIASPAFAERAAELGGYDTAPAGRVRYVG